MEATQTSKTEQEHQQDELLVTTLEQLNYFFKPVFLIALKQADRKKLSPEESSQLESSSDNNELVLRFKGLIKRFGLRFNDALKTINVNYSVNTDIQEDANEYRGNKQKSEDSSQRKKVPKGFALWDLKALKLHETETVNGEKIWVAYWNLKGESGVGEFVINIGKKILYFRPFDIEKCSPFPLVIDDGRTASREGKSCYFKVVDEPE